MLRARPRLAQKALRTLAATRPVRGTRGPGRIRCNCGVSKGRILPLLSRKAGPFLDPRKMDFRPKNRGWLMSQGHPGTRDATIARIKMFDERIGMDIKSGRKPRRAGPFVAGDTLADQAVEQGLCGLGR